MAQRTRTGEVVAIGGGGAWTIGRCPRLAVEGNITVGELVAVYGYVTVLGVPVASFIEGAVDLSQALVAGRRVTDFFAFDATTREQSRRPVRAT